MLQLGNFLQVTASVILLLQFVTIPGLGDIASAGKLYPMAFSVMGAAMWLTFRDDELRVTPVAAVFCGLFLVFFLSALQAIEPLWAMLQVGMLAVFVVYLLLVTHLSAHQPAFARLLVDALLLSGVVAAALGLYECVHFRLLGPTRDHLIPYLLPSKVEIRLGGPYGQPNQFALFLSVSLLAFFYRYLHSPLNHAKTALAKLRFLPFLLVAGVFFLTLSRSALLSVGLIFGFLAWLVASRRYLANEADKRREFLCLVLLMGVAFLAVKGVAWTSAPEMKMVRSLGDTGINPSGRFVFWTSALLIFRDHPWLGVGLDHYKYLMNGYGPQSHELLGFVPYEAMKSTNWAHNELLQVLCEGGMFAFALVVFLLGLLLLKIWQHFIGRKRAPDPFPLYKHLMLLPFVIQSMFEWPLRSPPLLILFFACMGVLLAEYPLMKIRPSLLARRSLRFFLLLGLGVAMVCFYQEIRIGAFKREFIREKAGVSTMTTFAALAENPYSRHRVFKGALPGYLREAFNRDDNAMVKELLPYYERLSVLEGARWQWYDLARIYLQLDREKDARAAIQRAIDLMPLDQRTEGFLHYLNMLEAARATGRPLDDFWPRGEKVDFRKLEASRD